MKKFITVIGLSLALLMAALIYSFSGRKAGFQNPAVPAMPPVPPPAAAPVAVPVAPVTPPAAVPPPPPPPPPAPEAGMATATQAPPTQKPMTVSGFQDIAKGVEGYDSDSYATYPF